MRKNHEGVRWLVTLALGLLYLLQAVNPPPPAKPPYLRCVECGGIMTVVAAELPVPPSPRAFDTRPEPTPDRNSFAPTDSGFPVDLRRTAILHHPLPSTGASRNTLRTSRHYPVLDRDPTMDATTSTGSLNPGFDPDSKTRGVKS